MDEIIKRFKDYAMSDMAEFNKRSRAALASGDQYSQGLYDGLEMANKNCLEILNFIKRAHETLQLNIHQRGEGN